MDWQECNQRRLVKGVQLDKDLIDALKKAIMALESEGKDEVRVDKALEELSEVDDDPNLHQYTRTQIWSVVSALEEK